MNNKVNIKIISLKEPCTACVIIGDAIKEILEKVKRESEKMGLNINIEILELEDLKQIHTIEGLEVEKFPAVIINGEQITAGSIPSKKQLLHIVKSIRNGET